MNEAAMKMEVKREARTSGPQSGAALVVTLILLVALLAVTALSLILTGTEQQLRTYSERQVELRYLANFAAEMGLSRLNRDEKALPDTGYHALEEGFTPADASGTPLDRVALNIYAGPTGSATGRTGSFASVVGEAEGFGARAIVRLELSQESFAKYAYYTDNEGGNIWFAGGDELYGPVHSNDEIKIHRTGATFHAEVTTASIVLYPEHGTFEAGYTEHVDKIEMPKVSDLDRLEALATAGGTFFTAPSNGGPDQIEMRVEFLAIDLNGDGDETDEDEGFFRVYRAPEPEWVGAYGEDFWQYSCGDYHIHPTTGEPWFISAINHKVLYNGEGFFTGYDAGDEDAEYVGPYEDEVEEWEGRWSLRHGTTGWGKVYQEAVGQPGARCFLGGDPRLTADNRSYDPWNGTNADPGWLRRADFMPSATLPAAAAARDDADFLFPLSREYNRDFRGVIFFDGLTGVSGLLNGRVTVVSGDNLVLLDDFSYSVPPNAEQCNDIAGFLTRRNFYVADNHLNTPQEFPDVDGGVRTYDDTSAEFLDGILMTLDKSFMVENFADGPDEEEPCEGIAKGRGCLYVTGGLIMKERGPVGLTSGEGYRKRYSYDANARWCPPPHFPTTGRFRKNRYYEVNPEALDDIGAYFAAFR